MRRAWAGDLEVFRAAVEQAGRDDYLAGRKGAQAAGLDRVLSEKFWPELVDRAVTALADRARRPQASGRSAAEIAADIARIESRTDPPDTPMGRANAHNLAALRAELAAAKKEAA